MHATRRIDSKDYNDLSAPSAILIINLLQKGRKTEGEKQRNIKGVSSNISVHLTRWRSGSDMADAGITERRTRRRFIFMHLV